jgi:hypothetical protein
VIDLTGVHAARAIRAQLGETSGGAPQVGVEFEITDIEGMRPRVSWYGFFTEKSEERTIESLRICGWTGTDFSDIQVGAEVSLVIENETYDGKTRQKVQWVNRPQGLAMKKQMGADAAKAFSAKMKGKLLAFDQKNGPTTGVGQLGQGPDIPF